MQVLFRAMQVKINTLHANHFEVTMLVMTDSLVPGWIKEIKDNRERDHAKAKSDALRAALIAKTIQADGPAFWKQLLKQLKITVDSLALIGVRGSLGSLSEVGSTTQEEAYQVAVSGGSRFPFQTDINLFYRPGDRIIRCHPQHGNSSQIHLCVEGETVRMLADGKALSAEEAAQYLVEPMVKHATAQQIEPIP